MFNQTSRSVIAIILFITLLLSTTFVFSEENETQQKEYYDLGLNVAEQDYHAGYAFLGGAFTSNLVAILGVTIGVIVSYESNNFDLAIPLCVIVDLAGWWGAYTLFAANKDTDVPQHYIAGLSIAQGSEFEDGYKDYVNKKRKISFLMGTGFGVATGIILVGALAGEW